MPISESCANFICETDFKKSEANMQEISQYPISLDSGNLQLEETKFPLLSLCFGKISPCRDLIEI